MLLVFKMVYTYFIFLNAQKGFPTFASGPSPSCCLLTQDTAFTSTVLGEKRGTETIEKAAGKKVPKVVMICLIFLKVGRKK